MKRRPRIWLVLLALSALIALPALAEPNVDASGATVFAGLSKDEIELWVLIQSEKYIDARELADKVVAANPESFVGHFALGEVHHYGESNFPRALLHERDALKLFESKYGFQSGDMFSSRWHAYMLRELASTYADLDRYEQQLAVLDRHNQLYTPGLYANRAWPLMKLKRFDEARLAAQQGLASGDTSQRDFALNSLCAIEFEAGDHEKSYQACGKALIQARIGGRPTTVDLSNHAEAARSLFRFEEAERLLMEATTAYRSWFGNPWRDLADLYMRGARISEALAALREIPSHRAMRPPHLREFDFNEGLRVRAMFYLLIDRPAEAIRITDKALVMPDRRAHSSRDAAQDQSLVALIDRRARRLLAERLIEEAVAMPFYQRWWVALKAYKLRVEGWRSGRLAARLLAEENRLVGTFMIGTSRGAIMPPWLLGELVDVLGSGVVVAAIKKARSEDTREAANSYYDAVLAEAALYAGDEADAIGRADKARVGIKSGDSLLQMRMLAIIAEAKRRQGKWPTYSALLTREPGLFRRMELALPVRFETDSSGEASAIKKALARSPRLDTDEETHLVVAISANELNAQVCLRDTQGQSWGCGRVVRQGKESRRDFVQKVIDDFHRAVFEPRVDLSQADIRSLDGTNRSVRNPLQPLFK